MATKMTTMLTRSTASLRTLCQRASAGLCMPSRGVMICCQSTSPLSSSAPFASSLSSATSPPVSSSLSLLLKRSLGTIKVIDEKRSGEETIYFKNEDNAILKNLLENHPEYNPKYSFSDAESEMSTLGRDLHIVCQKHGINYTSLAFLRDIKGVFESNGWKCVTDDGSSATTGGEKAKADQK